MTKPIIHFRSRHESGNIFVILGLVQREFRKLHRITDYNNLRDRVFDTNSYSDALKAIREQVNLIDDDGVF